MTMLTTITSKMERDIVAFQKQTRQSSVYKAARLCSVYVRLQNVEINVGQK